LPTDLQGFIRMVDKVATIGGGSGSAPVYATQVSQDKLWLFSQKEIDNTVSSGYNSEGQQYEYWLNGMQVTAANAWWLRSSTVTSAVNFRLVSTDGSILSNGASGAYGVCFGFCV